MFSNDSRITMRPSVAVRLLNGLHATRMRRAVDDFGWFAASALVASLVNVVVVVVVVVVTKVD